MSFSISLRKSASRAFVSCNASDLDAVLALAEESDVPVLAISALSPILIADWHMRSRDVALSLPQEAAAEWIAAKTPERSVFITDDFINSPVDLAGRLRISTFGPYVSNLGYDPGVSTLRGRILDGTTPLVDRDFTALGGIPKMCVDKNTGKPWIGARSLSLAS